MKKKILVIGCGISQEPTLQAVKTLGHTSIGVDGSENACSIKYADIFEKCDIKDLDKVLEIAKKHSINGIVVPGTDFPETAAYVAEKMGLPGIPLNVAQLCTNKYEQKIFLKEKGFLVPEIYMPKDEFDTSTSNNCKISPPLVMKPLDSMAARGSQKIYNWANFIDAYNTAKTFSRTERVVAEQFEEGIELSVDSLV